MQVARLRGVAEVGDKIMAPAPWNARAPAAGVPPVAERQASAVQLAELLQECKAVLLDRGMADMEEYGTCSNGGAAQGDGASAAACTSTTRTGASFSDRFRGTIHYHAAPSAARCSWAVRAFHYEAKRDPAGDRSTKGGYTLTRHTSVQSAAPTYELPSMVRTGSGRPN